MVLPDVSVLILFGFKLSDFIVLVNLQRRSVLDGIAIMAIGTAVGFALADRGIAGVRRSNRLHGSRTGCSLLTKANQHPAKISGRTYCVPRILP
ncbi:hypothetical protein [Sphingomonas sp. T9W2]|uniref:hypothetical protein n=1 Tax=Sphingomonas sp. T9W2 TaxID=3143183 RepID=UPI0031F4C3C9